MKSARYDEASGRWSIETTQGERFDAQYYVIATGCLSVPKEIDIPGRDCFAGRSYHTADWPRAGVDFSGQKVGVIGTGSSAIQSIPIIAGQAAELTVFQRTPAFSLPAYNRPFSDADRAAWRARYADHRARSRLSAFGVPDQPMEKSALEVSAEERERAYEEGWQSGTLISMLQKYNDLLTNVEANETAAEFVREKIRSIVRDPEVAETLCPYSFPIGTKRACLDTNYYQTFNLPHVHLVDLRKTPIEAVTPGGVRTTAREYAFDAIVYATGFDAMTGAIVNVDVRGRGGQSLAAKWTEGTRTYLGLASRRFPEPVHDHRSRQPVGDEQHDPLHRAARRLDRRLPDVDACARPRHDRGRGGGRAGVGRSRERGRGRDAVSACELLVHGRERARQAARVHALYRRRRRVPAEVRRGRGSGLHRLPLPRRAGRARGRAAGVRRLRHAPGARAPSSSENRS